MVPRILFLVVDSSANARIAPDKRIRDKALESLKMFLQSRTEGLDEIELLKLWKGLFFCTPQRFHALSTTAHLSNGTC